MALFNRSAKPEASAATVRSGDDVSRTIEARRSKRKERDMAEATAEADERAKADVQAAVERDDAAQGHAELEYSQGRGPEPEALRDRGVENDRYMKAITSRARESRRRADALNVEVRDLAAPIHAARGRYLADQKNANTKETIDLIAEIIERFKPIFARARAIKNTPVTNTILSAKLMSPDTVRNAFHQVQHDRGDTAMREMFLHALEELTAIDAELKEN